MRKSLVLIFVAAALSSSALTAKAPRPGPLKCTTTGGDSKDPFYGVTASQNMMPPINKPRPIGVSGQYRLDMRSGKLALVQAVPHGINPSILLLRMRMLQDPRGGGHCLSFKGSFPAQRALQVQIIDWRGHSITVDVQRPQ